MGEWAAAWDIYDWRWRRGNPDPQAFLPPLEPDRLQRAARVPNEQKVFIWAEQGLGDEVFHASMFEDAVNRFGAVTIQADGRFIPLLERSVSGANFVERSAPVEPTRFDMHLSQGDLGYFFRRTVGDFQGLQECYLRADQARVAELRSHLQTDSRPLVGIAWRSKNNRFGSSKSVTLESLLPVLRNPRLRFVNLQYGDTAEELETFRREHGIEIVRCTSVNNFLDIDGHAALIEACETVLTVSNTTAHIAGALGKPTFVMLPKGEGRLWFWVNRHARRSMWYPTVEVFEQPKHGEWDDVVSNIAVSIAERYRDQ
jgi:hypothetical protein